LNFYKNILVCLIFCFVTILRGQNEGKQYEILIEELNSARVLKDNNKLAEAYFNLAQYEENVLLDEKETFENYTRAKQYYARGGDDEKIKIIDHKIAVQYVKSGFKSEALLMYSELIDYYKANKKDSILARMYYEVGKIYKEKGETDKALDYYKKSITINFKGHGFGH
jgi:tetratricopeptide (TPR) repeat protein